MPHRKIKGDDSIPCNHYKKPTKQSGKIIDGKLVITQPEELKKCCTALHVEYYPDENEKIELCNSNDFKKCERYRMRQGQKPIEENKRK